MIKPPYRRIDRTSATIERVCLDNEGRPYLLLSNLMTHHVPYPLNEMGLEQLERLFVGQKYTVLMQTVS